MCFITALTKLGLTSMGFRYLSTAKWYYAAQSCTNMDDEFVITLPNIWLDIFQVEVMYLAGPAIQNDPENMFFGQDTAVLSFKQLYLLEFLSGKHVLGLILTRMSSHIHYLLHIRSPSNTNLFQWCTIGNARWKQYVWLKVQNVQSSIIAWRSSCNL